jgi:hypothetical protein
MEAAISKPRNWGNLSTSARRAALPNPVWGIIRMTRPATSLRAKLTAHRTLSHLEDETGTGMCLPVSPKRDIGYGWLLQPFDFFAIHA